MEVGLGYFFARCENSYEVTCGGAVALYLFTIKVMHYWIPHLISKWILVFCCIVAWIQPDIFGCQQDFLVVWRWNQLRTFQGIFENNFIDFREAVSLEKIFEIVQENTLKFSKLISFLGNKKSSLNQCQAWSCYYATGCFVEFLGQCSADQTACVRTLAAYYYLGPSPTFWQDRRCRHWRCSAALLLTLLLISINGRLNIFRSYIRRESELILEFIMF